MKVLIRFIILIVVISSVHLMTGCSGGSYPPTFVFDIQIDEDDAEEFLLNVGLLAEALDLELRDASGAVSRLEKEETVFRFYKSSQVMLEINNLLMEEDRYRISFYIVSEREVFYECKFLVEAQHYLMRYVDFTEHEEKIERCITSP